MNIPVQRLPFFCLLLANLLLLLVKRTGTCPSTSTVAQPVVTMPAGSLLATTSSATTSTSPTTTSTATTSTTTTTTTTTTTNPCAQCTLATITLTAGDGTNTATPTTPGVQCCDAAGCSFLVVTCTALPGGQVFMQFNVNQGGPLNPIGTVVTATLNCNANMQWEFRPGMGLPNRIITEVNCVLAGGG